MSCHLFLLQYVLCWHSGLDESRLLDMWQGLRAQNVLYCICRKPYDEEQAMIACDCCGEWYHYSCLQLPEPDIDEDLPDQHNSDDFMCPDCEDQARLVQMPLHCKEVDLLVYRQNFE